MAVDELGSKDERTAVDKAISVLKAFGKDAQIGLGVTEISRRAGLSKSTAFRLLAMLERNGVVERAGTAYRLGPVLHELGAQSSSASQDQIRDLLTPFLADLYEATHLTSQLAVLSGSHVIYLNKLEGHRRLRTPSRINGRMPAYCTGVGKVMLAFNPEAAEEALKAPRHAWTPNTIVDEDAFRRELAQVRAAGVAFDNGESLESLSCIAAPVVDGTGKVVAAMSVSGDSGSFNPRVHEHVLRQVCFQASKAVKAMKAAAATVA